MSIAVICLARDAEQSLPATIGNLVGLSRAPDEILVVDRGSGDGTLAVARAFEPAVRVLACGSLDAAAARAMAADAARSERLMFVEAGDLLAPDTTAELATALDTAPGGVATCPSLHLDPHEEGCRATRVDPAPTLRGMLWSREAYDAVAARSGLAEDESGIVARLRSAGVRIVTTSGGGAYRRSAPPVEALPGGPAPNAKEMRGSPLVSVVIPAYKRADTLPRAIESVLSQDWPNLEILVVDDASPDKTPEIVARFAAADPRVRHLRQKANRGVAAARNRGIREARGPLVAFLDADDEWLPGKLVRQVEALRSAGPGIGLVYTGVESVGGDGDRSVMTAEKRGHVFPLMLARNVLHGAPSSALVRRSVFATIGLFGEDLPAAEDYEFWLRLTRFHAVEAIADPLVRYHDPAGDPLEDELRRSRNLAANRAARETIFQRYRLEMRRCGVEHLHILDIARREREIGTRRAWARQIARLAASSAGRAHLARALLRRTIVRGRAAAANPR